MPARKPAAKNAKTDAKAKDTKQAAVETPTPNPRTGRDPAAPDSGDTPMAYDTHGDAHPLAVEPDHSTEANRPDGSTLPKVVDPLLHPDAQQPGESAEDYAKRRALA